MNKLTETRIEIADRHTSLCFLHDPPEAGPLGERTWSSLYASVCKAVDADFSLISTSAPDPILNRLFSICSPSNRRFWKEYLGGVEFQPGLALREGLPIQASIDPFVTIDLAADYAAKVSPVVYVLLYPFGWSTWISIRVTKEHTLGDIELLLAWVFQGKAFQIDSAPGTLDDLFDSVSSALRQQVFAGLSTRDKAARDCLVTTTVMSKVGASRSLAALTGEQETQMKALVTPRGPLPARPLSDLVFYLAAKKKELNYLVFNDLARFTWLEQLLEPEGRNRQHLQCYHNNNFLSLIQAWHLEGLLDAAKSTAHPAAPLSELTKTAIDRLTDPRRKNAGLVAYLASDRVKKTLAAWEKQAD
jgi:hypothetical protein